MRGVSTLLILAVAMLPVAASAEDKPKPDDRMICKREKKTGTRFTTKICKTAAQWEAISEAAYRATGEMMNRPQTDMRRGN